MKYNLDFKKDKINLKFVQKGRPRVQDYGSVCLNNDFEDITGTFITLKGRLNLGLTSGLEKTI